MRYRVFCAAEISFCGLGVLTANSVGTFLNFGQTIAIELRFVVAANGCH